MNRPRPDREFSRGIFYGVAAAGLLYAFAICLYLLAVNL